ncbi:hypothetical protein SLOPH_1019 [Spraguea lophii 42_110]|uniref:USP domain-containing protein n=1 Tax=Spraguea lophii (strain 42_110) TaxID=1358809 RepID=S7XIA6_SPRLO|nr:hypothetical protein SLOPH_1019 [Spraguea lophii 42_110]
MFKILSAIIIGSIGICYLYYKSYTFLKINYKTIHNEQLNFLDNDTGVCYMNATMQILYCGHGSRYFLNKDWPEDTVENKLKKTFLKMNTDLSINLYENYTEIYSCIGKNKEDLDKGGSTLVFFIHIFVKILKNAERNGNMEEFEEYFTSLVDNLIVYFSYKKLCYLENKSTDEYETYNHLKEKFDGENLDVHSTIVNCVKDFKIFPKIIPIIIDDLAVKERGGEFKVPEVEVFVEDKKYVLRSLLIRTEIQSGSHAYVIVNQGDSWVVLNDLVFYKIKECDLKKHKYIHLMMYELE